MGVDLRQAGGLVADVEKFLALGDDVGGLIALPDNELSAQDIARLADVGVKIERMSRGDSAESIAVSAKATVEHSGGLELSGSIPDMSDLSDEELENLHK